MHIAGQEGQERRQYVPCLEVLRAYNFSNDNTFRDW
jgi:hypothetical protein